MLPVLPSLSVGLTGLLEQRVPEAFALPLVAFNLFPAAKVLWLSVLGAQGGPKTVRG
jgi:hypothetical protein